MRKAAIALALLLAVPGASFGGVQATIMLDSKVESMKKAGVGPVKYPHDAHEKLYRCEECHPKIFKDKIKGNDLSMKANMEGRFCGSPNCHNSPKAFPLFMCQNCHTNVGAAK